MPLKNLFNLTNLTLIVALGLSTVAAYYSIIGLTAIFAGAVIPIIIMGSILEIGKITTTVWLKKYWSKCRFLLKFYLVSAVVVLAILTSMGIFGFLSKAHTDSGLVSGDVQAKLSLIDEKIKTQRDNIEIARKALQQMDAQVDARLARGDSESGAERAVQIRRQQAGERAKLQKEIGEAQKIIAQLNEERAPIAAENRKVEAEVGPIKYVAALIYGDNPDSNLLERAVRWVIILLVIVFDPLAIALVLAANSSKEWDKQVNDDIAAMNINPEPPGVDTRPFTEEELKAMETPWPTEWKEWTDNDVQQAAEETFKEIEKEEKIDSTEPKPYLNTGFKYPKDWNFEKPLVYTPEKQEKPEHVPEEPVVVKKVRKKSATKKTEKVEEPKPEEPVQEVVSTPIETEGVTRENPIKELVDGYVNFEGKVFKKDALKELRPDLFMLTVDQTSQIKTNFGTQFPKVATKGDIFVRVDALPNIPYKFDGRKWIELNKGTTDSYLYDQSYVQFLIDKIASGEYDIELLSDNEKTLIEDHLKNQK